MKFVILKAASSQNIRFCFDDADFYGNLCETIKSSALIERFDFICAWPYKGG